MSPDLARRVLIAIGTLEIGGAERQIVEVCRALTGRGFQFDVVTMGDEGLLAEDLRGAGARMHSLRVGRRGSSRVARLLRLVRSVPRMRALLRELRPDLIHAYLTEMSVVAAAGRWPRRRPPLILSKRSLAEWVARDPIYFPLARWMNRRADVILANSNAVAGEAIRKENADPKRVRVIHNGVDMERYHPGPPEEALVRELGIPAGVPVIGMVANFFVYKGHADVVQAAAILRGQGLEFTLLFVGRDGDASETVRRQIREAGLTDRVRFAGPRPDVSQLLRLFDVFVSASHEEGFSNAILEAMASGRAIVAASVGGTLEQIEDGASGLLVPPGNPQVLAHAISRLLRDADLRSRLAAAARESALLRFSLERLADRTCGLYREIVSSGEKIRQCTNTRRGLLALEGGVSLNDSMPDAISLLLREREKRGELWGTLDPETLKTFQGIFEEVGGRGRRFLEVGSGNGFTCVLFGLLGASEVQGFEVVPEAVAVAEEVKNAVAPNAPVFFLRGDAADGLPYPDNSFDVLLLIEVVSHVVTENLLEFFREMVRVLKPGGLLYLQDGNNARSWFLRRKNYGIWERFEKGPATGPGETVHSHRIGRPYVETRRNIAAGAAPSLSPQEAQRIAEGTFCFSEAQVREAVARYVETGELPSSRFRRKLCPIEPMSRTYIEQLVDPMEVRGILPSLGCKVLVIRPRRHLPANALWAAFPRLTMLISNGFTMIARKG